MSELRLDLSGETRRLMRYFWGLVCIFVWLAAVSAIAQTQALGSSDLSRLRNVGSAVISPDGRSIAYSIAMRDLPGRPYGTLWVMDVSSGKSVRLGGDRPAGGPVWSNDGKWIAFHGAVGDQHGLVIARPDGSDATFLAALSGTNSPLRGRARMWRGHRMGRRLPLCHRPRGLRRRRLPAIRW